MGSGVQTLVVITAHPLVQNSLGLLDIGDFFSDTGSDESILQPAVRSFNLASGLRGQGVDDLYIAVLQNLFPLRGSFIGQQMVVSPEGVSALDKAKDGVGIDVIGVRKAMPENEGLESQNMGPAGFLLD